MFFIIGILILLLLTGCTIGSFFRWHPTQWLEWIVISLGLGTVGIGSAVLLLVTIDQYNKPITATLALALLITAVIRHKSIREMLPSPPKTTMERVESIALIGLFIGASALCFRPHETIFGGADSGIYLSIAGQMAREGDILINEPIIEQFTAEQTNNLFRTEGAYSVWSVGFPINEQSQTVTPRFYHFHSALQSLGFLWGGGLNDALNFSPLWGVLSLLSVVGIGRSLFTGKYGRWIAIASASILAITSLQIWFVRYSTTESLTQWLVWSGILGWLLWADSKYEHKFYALFAGLGWAAAHLTRIDTFFLWGAVGLLFIWLLLQRQLKTFHWFAIPQLVGQLLAIQYSLRFSPFYLEELYGIIGRDMTKYSAPLLIISVVGLIALVGIMRNRTTISSALTRGAMVGRFVLIAIITGLFLYNWFIRPQVGSVTSYDATWGINVQQWNHENLIRMRWYLTTPVVWLGLLGVLFTLYKSSHKSLGWIVIGLLYTLFYMYNIRSNGIHMYALRRFVPFTIPFIILAIGGLISAVSHWRGRIGQILGLLLILIWSAGSMWSARGLISQIDQVSAVSQYETFASNFEPNSIIIFGQPSSVGIADHVGVPLSLLDDQQLFILHEQGDADGLRPLLDSWLTEYPVYWVHLDDSLSWPYDTINLQEIAPLQFHINGLEGSYERRPTTIQDHVWNGRIYQVIANK